MQRIRLKRILKIINSKKAFTLIEVMVAIAIVGLLASIVIVAVNGARERARMAGAKQFYSSVNNILGSEAVAVWSFESLDVEGVPPCSSLGSYDKRAVDTSGNGNDACSRWASVDNNGVFGKSYHSNGGTCCDATVADASSSNGPFSIRGNITLAAWVYIFDTSVSLQGIISKWSSGGNRSYALHLTGDKAVMRVAGPNTQVSNGIATSDISLQENKWYFLVGSYDGSMVRIYVDGIERGSASHTDGMTGKGAFRIANAPQLSSYQFGGLIDEMGVYKEALSSAQIRQYYARSDNNHN